jgi:hypothetical protein
LNIAIISVWLLPVPSDPFRQGFYIPLSADKKKSWQLFLFLNIGKPACRCQQGRQGY